jgi:DUF1680 family protein
VALLSDRALLAQAPRPVAEAALDIYTPVALDQQRFAGMFSNRSRANREGYLEHIDENALLAPFERRAEAQSDPALAEGAGLFLVAASNSYEATDDAHLKKVMDRVVGGVIKAQQRDGYLGIYAADARWGTGDVLTQAATLIGLLAYSNATGEDDAANSARRAVDLMISQFAQRKTPPPDASALLPVLSELYRSTGDARYLNFSRELADVSGPGDTPLVVALRAYGLVELYRLTGDDAHLKAAQSTWQSVEDSHPSVTGVPGPPDRLDGCLTLAWFQLTLDLFRITGQSRYASALEQIVYNAVLPAQESNTGDIDAGIRLGSPKKFGHTTEVCSAAAAVALSELANISWGRYGRGLAVLSYNPGRASLRLHRRGTVQLYSEGDYPASGSILLHVEPTHDIRFPLRLYVPTWTNGFVASIGETRLSGQPGQFLILNREWHRGDTVKISIEMTASLVRDPLDARRVALRRGPQLLALGQPEDDPEHLILPANAAATLTGAASAALSNWTELFKVSALENGRAREVIVMPFADSTSSGIWFGVGT